MPISPVQQNRAAAASRLPANYNAKADLSVPFTGEDAPSAGYSQAKPASPYVAAPAPVQPQAAQAEAEAVLHAAARAGSKATHTDAVRPALIPTPAQMKEMTAALKLCQWQKAIDLTVRYYGIDISSTKGGKSALFDANFKGANAHTDQLRVMHLAMPLMIEALQLGPDALAATIAHEATHARQFERHGFPKSNQQVAAYELMAHESIMGQAKELKLPELVVDHYNGMIQSYREALSPENRAKYEAGQYWDLYAGPEYENKLPAHHHALADQNE